MKVGWQAGLAVLIFGLTTASAFERSYISMAIPEARQTNFDPIHHQEHANPDFRDTSVTRTETFPTYSWRFDNRLSSYFSWGMGINSTGAIYKGTAGNWSIRTIADANGEPTMGLFSPTNFLFDNRKQYTTVNNAEIHLLLVNVDVNGGLWLPIHQWLEQISDYRNPENHEIYLINRIGLSYWSRNPINNPETIETLAPENHITDNGISFSYVLSGLFMFQSWLGFSASFNISSFGLWSSLSFFEFGLVIDPIEMFNWT